MGGGFGGIVAAYLLAREGRQVTLVDRRGLGGIAGGVSWEGFSLDLGCHIFGNSSNHTTEILLDLLGGEALPVQMNFASRFGGKVLEGFELPDLSAVASSAQMILEIAQAASEEHLPPETLSQLLLQRFGSTAAQASTTAFKKIYQVDPAEIAPQAIHATCFKRVRVVDDATASVLKESKALDELIAAGSQADPMRFYQACTRYPHRAFYPSKQGMRGFVNAARERLEALGVRFVLGEEIVGLDLESGVRLTTSEGLVQADQCLWTAGLASLETTYLQTSTLAGTSHGVAMVLYYFDIDPSQEGPYSYVNSFEHSDLVFRASLPGKYGQGTNCPPGRSYLCCEVPTTTDSEIFASPDAHVDAVWQDASCFGAVRGQRGRYQTLKTPVSYKIPRADFYSLAAPIRQRLAPLQALSISDEWAFTKNLIVENISKLVRDPGEAVFEREDEGGESMTPKQALASSHTRVENAA